MSVYCIDIDGVLCTNTDGEYERAEPIRENIAALHKLYAAGHEIHLWTARGATTGKNWESLTVRQLREWNVPFHYLRLDKPHYDYIVDDKCTVLPPA